MNIIEESFRAKDQKKKDNSKLVMKLILASIMLLILIVIGLFIAIIYIKQSELLIYLNGSQNTKIKQLMIEEDNNKIYFPIKEIATYFGYTSYNGEYSDKSEDTSKCYIQNNNEIANFSLNSNEIYKLNLSDDSNYECVNISNPIKSINGILYIEANDMQEAFNVSYSYDLKNKMYIYTLDYLVERYTTSALNFGYVLTNNTFKDEKSLLDGFLIVTKDDKNYGVIDLKGNVILETKYDNIEYLPNSEDFLVTSNNRVGIISKNKETKVSILYSDLKLIDNESNLYLAEKDKKYGIIDSNGNVKIYIEYDQIGIDNAKFDKNGIKNKYILANNLIPVKKDNKWALFDKTGKQISDFVYDGFGCVATNKDAINLLVIPDYNVLVANQNGKYLLIDAYGEEKSVPILDEVYMTISSGKKHYTMSFNDKTYDVLSYLEGRGLKKESNSTTNTLKESNTIVE